MDVELLASQQAHLADRLAGKIVLVSGATGLVGSAVVRYIMDLNYACDAGIRAVGLFRDEEKLARMHPIARGDVEFVHVGDSGVPDDDVQADYVVHAAGISGGTKMHLKDPVRVFDVGIGGTKALLDYAVAHGCRRFCYVSTYEVYGDATRAYPMAEEEPSVFDTMALRNSYAEVKRVCEAMLAAYASAFRIEVFSGRLTPTFGHGVSYNDPRFFAEFGRCVAEGRDIVLRTSGATVRRYLDSDDAASAFLYLLADGKSCNAYNVTNKANEISIREIAEMFARASGGCIQVRLEVPDDVKRLGFRREGRVAVDVGKLEALGWQPAYSMADTVDKLIKEFENCVACEERMQ